MLFFTSSCAYKKICHFSDFLLDFLFVGFLIVIQGLFERQNGMQEHCCSCTVVPSLKPLWLFEVWKGCGVSRSIYLTTFFGRTSIIYVIRDISFQPETTYPAFRRAVPYTEVSLFLTGVLANREMLFYIPIRFKVYRSLNKEVVAPLSDSFPFTVR